MQSLFILKTGATHPEISECFGDFEDWIIAGMGKIDFPIVIREIYLGKTVPQIDDCAGVILTGSPAMVTDKHAWSVALEKWLVKAVQVNVPILGICYGHQLLAEAFGGEVGDHPNGKEIGTVQIHCKADAKADPLFAGFPDTFPAHVTHLQSALRLPSNAMVLASNDFEQHHAFHMGECAWGVQFHPEFNSTIMRAYISHQKHALKAMGIDPSALLKHIEDTPWATKVLSQFAAYLSH